MLIYAAVFRCLEPVATIAASLSSRSPFVSPFQKRDEATEAKRQFAVNRSDHLTLLGAFRKWEAVPGRQAKRQFCGDNYLSDATLRQISDLRDQFYEILVEIGFAPRREKKGLLGGQDLNQNSGRAEVGNKPMEERVKNRSLSLQRPPKLS